MKKRPNILTIAGFDPSNGAGLTADIKTFEQLNCYGLSVCSANTIQTDLEFKSCYWTPIEIITEQIDLLFKRFQIEYVKVGIVENWQTLLLLIHHIQTLNPSAKIIMDPVLSSTSNFDFHLKANLDSSENRLDELLANIYLLTPNYDEIKQLYPQKGIEETIKHISSKTNLLLKGGHHQTKTGKDQLFTLEGKFYSLNPKLKNCSEKHGSGCVLSSAITSYLALGYPLLKACYKGKRYTEKVLSSNKSLLGYHG